MHISTPSDIDVRHIMGQGPQSTVFDTLGRAELRRINEAPFAWLLALQLSITYLVEFRFTDEEVRALIRPLRMRKRKAEPHQASDSDLQREN